MAEFDPEEFAATKKAQSAFDPTEFAGSTPAKDGKPARVIINTRPDTGTADAFARGAANGLSANFYDEIRGLVEASGAEPKDPASIYKLIHGAVKYYGGDPEAAQRYDTAATRERELNKDAEANHPYATVAGNVAGAVALPLGAAGGAATLPGRMAAGAGVGAATGAAYGAGEGTDLTDRASRALVGGVAGGALGAVAPPLVEGAIQGVSKVAQPFVTGIRGAINPENEAARRVATSIGRDIEQDPGATSRLTPAEFVASAQNGGPARILDMGGETTRALARSAANTSPEGRAALNQSIDERFAGQGPRVITWLQNTFHYPNALAQQEALDQSARVVNRTNYGNAFRAGDRELFSPEMERLVGSPAVVEAMRAASTSGKDRAITQGFGAFNPGVTVENGVVNFQKGKNGVPTYPNLQFWDATKRELDDAANAARRAGRDGEAGVLEGLARNLRGELDNLVPSYATARSGAASFFGAENALDAGQNFVTSKLGNDQARAALARMTPNDRQLFQDGFVSRFIQHLGETGDRRNILNQIGASPAARERLNIALGPQRAAEMEAGLRVEGIVDLARNAVTGNSTTARQLAELGFAGGAGSLGVHGGYNQSPGEMTAAAVAGALLAGKRHIDGNVARRVAEMLVSSDPATLMRGIRLVSNNGRFMDSLRSVDRRIAAVGGEQVPHAAPALQSIGIGRADQNQPAVPGPL